MTNLFTMFETNSDLESEGVIFELGEAKFKLRRMGGANSQKLKAAHAKYFKPFAKQIEMGTLNEQIEKEIVIKSFFEICVVSWEGFKNKEGVEIECNLKNALEVFKQLPELFNLLQSHASDFNHYRVDLGNA
jgi:hypothetical protein